MPGVLHPAGRLLVSEEYNAVLALARKGIPEQGEIAKGSHAAGTAAAAKVV
jgi:hypothetical protein